MFKNIRGNVQTRLFKLEHEDYDATILALAGLKRLGMEGCVSRIFSVDEMIPSAGQGLSLIHIFLFYSPEIRDVTVEQKR